MKIIDGQQHNLSALTPQQIGARLWNTEYKGTTIGQLFLATLSVMRTCDSELIANCSERALLSELGLHAHRRQSGPKANLGDPYLHILNARQLYKRIPELKRWHSTMLGWYGVALGGVPYLCEPGAVRRDEPLKRKAKPKPMLSLKESSALERLAAATGADPAVEPAAPTKARSKAKPAPMLSPAEGSAQPAHTATVIQFPGRR